MRNLMLDLKIVYGRTIITRREEDELPEEDKKRCLGLLPLTSDSLEVLRIYSVERRQKWGREEREVESERRRGGRVMEIR